MAKQAHHQRLQSRPDWGTHKIIPNQQQSFPSCLLKSAEFCGQLFFYRKLADFRPYLFGVGKHRQMPSGDLVLNLKLMKHTYGARWV